MSTTSTFAAKIMAAATLVTPAPHVRADDAPFFCPPQAPAQYRNVIGKTAPAQILPTDTNAGKLFADALRLKKDNALANLDEKKSA